MFRITVAPFPFAERLGQFSDLLAEPEIGAGDPPGGVGGVVPLADMALEIGDSHG